MKRFLTAIAGISIAVACACLSALDEQEKKKTTGMQDLKHSLMLLQEGVAKFIEEADKKIEEGQ